MKDQTRGIVQGHVEAAGTAPAKPNRLEPTTAPLLAMRTLTGCTERRGVPKQLRGVSHGPLGSNTRCDIGFHFAMCWFAVCLRAAVRAAPSLAG